MVSIIIPYIDEHEYLAEAIASALAQDGTEIELIIVCNAPSIPGGNNPIHESHTKAIFIHEPLRGSAHARNAGLRAARGEWVQFLDVDDLLLPGKIRHQLNVTDADVMVSPHSYQYLNGNHEKSKWIPEDIWCGMLDSGLGSTSSILWRRQSVLDCEGWNTGYQSHQEYELLFRLAAAGKKIEAITKYDTVVRQRKTGSITSTSKPVRVQEGIKLREMMWQYLVSKQIDTPERYDAFRQYIFRQLRGLFRQDRKGAMSIYGKYFSGQPFTPKEIHVPGYSILYRLIGFYNTESIIQNFVSLRNNWLKRLKS